jgi:hypothetical protein
MTTKSRVRRIGWVIVLALCTALYLLLHLQVHAVRSDVIRAERRIVQLEQEKLLLETEFETRANLLQLAAWNRVDFGYTAPSAAQFLANERQLVSFGSPRAASAPEPIRVARGSGEETLPFPKLVSPMTGKPLDKASLEAATEQGAQLAVASSAGGTTRIPLRAMLGTEGR